MSVTRVAVQVPDPLTRAGLTSYLQSRPETTVVTCPPLDTDVIVLAVDRITPDVLATLRRWAGAAVVPVVLIIGELSEKELLTVVECRVAAVLPRAAATGDRLIASIKTVAAGGGLLPSKMLGDLLKQVEKMQREVLGPRGLNGSGLNTREIDVLRLMADGMDTAEIASKLCYSERTVKNVIYGVTSRLNLRNRAHAVAYALRTGII
ncbi:helix-turn-helix transcriptional regulator [Labedaea rhizosphaerae]|uniref:DNA-binding NarL/FixJ family response regulator n=1 Tax=Labedaea rhizosphaerae TaxID=598644 RepID=A0A4R6SCT9_LABRH|nr:response regulator transcription factor [Labedaea rhizosphaerae]TDP97752.1 DNA-binding NarL/FixJ family response regulator [Labedaea rhizosphaerae]